MTTGDNTQLPAGGGGDTIRTYAVTQEDGTIVKIQGMAVTVMQQGYDGRPVVRADPLPVFDEDSHDVLVEIRDLMMEIREILR